MDLPTAKDNKIALCNVCGEWVTDLKKHWGKRHEGKDNLTLRDL